MQKSIRSFAVLAIFALAVVPAVRADQTGCNPHPAAGATLPASVVTFVNAVLSFLGA
jgi:hypothetical protein